MCIRDSVELARRLQLGERELSDVLLARRAVSRAALAGVAPVSYTHLRAHETVLDLVCRLLLEKKKKTNDTHTT